MAWGFVSVPGRGPDGDWLIDIEGDGPKAEESFCTLVGLDRLETMGWSSLRGRHSLFLADGKRLLLLLIANRGDRGGHSKYPGKWDLGKLPDLGLPGLELRIGGYKGNGAVKQFQSAIPPTPDRYGQTRAWNGRWRVRQLPEAVYAYLETKASEKRQQASPRESHVQPCRCQPMEFRSIERNSALRKYVDAAVRGECEAVAGTPENDRNNRLNNAAVSLGELVGARVLSREEVCRRLLDAARASGLDDAESIATINSGLNFGITHPRDLSKVGRRGRPPTRTLSVQPSNESTLHVKPETLMRSREALIYRGDAEADRDTAVRQLATWLLNYLRVAGRPVHLSEITNSAGAMGFIGDLRFSNRRGVAVWFASSRLHDAMKMIIDPHWRIIAIKVRNDQLWQAVPAAVTAAKELRVYKSSATSFPHPARTPYGDNPAGGATEGSEDVFALAGDDCNPHHQYMVS